MAFTVFYTVQISDVATKIFEAAGGKAVVTNHFFDEAGYIEELKALKPEAKNSVPVKNQIYKIRKELRKLTNKVPSQH